VFLIGKGPYLLVAGKIPGLDFLEKLCPLFCDRICLTGLHIVV